MNPPIFGIILGISVLGFTWNGVTNSKASLLKRLPVMILAAGACAAIVMAVFRLVGTPPI